MGLGVISEKRIGGGKGVGNRKDTDGIACNQVARMSTYAMNRFHFLNTIETCSIESAKEKTRPTGPMGFECREWSI